MKYLFLFFCFLLNTSCSRTGLVYRFFDTLAISKTDDYFDLTSEQKENLKQDLKSDLEKLRKEFLPTAAQALRELAPLAEQKTLDQELALKKSQEIQSKFQQLMQYFKGTTLKTALVLEPRQFEYFAKEVRAEVADNETEDAQEEAYTRYRRSLEFWLGGINSEQKEKLQTFLKRHPYPAKLQAQSKIFVLENFMKTTKDRGQLTKFIENYMSNSEAVRLPLFTEKITEHKIAFQRFFATELWPTLTSAQRQHLRENLLARAQELEELSQRP